jgi:hypothetical protein
LVLGKGRAGNQSQRNHHGENAKTLIHVLVNSPKGHCEKQSKVLTTKSPNPRARVSRVLPKNSSGL